jgi:hypothetical protein
MIRQSETRRDALVRVVRHSPGRVPNHIKLRDVANDLCGCVVFKLAYGFLWSEEVGRRVFFHVADLAGPDPSVGDEMEFSLAPSRKPGFPDQAVNVRLIKKANHPGAAALGSKITTSEVEGVRIVRTEAV